MTGDVAALVRYDPRFFSLGLDPAKYTTPGAIADLLVEHPELMQRPLIDDGIDVIIARPARRAEEWLASR